MSVTHFQKGAEPYMGYLNSYGIVFPIAPPSTFWKYFQKRSTTGDLCGLCCDGQTCDPSRRAPLGDMTWDTFQEQKNAVVAKTGTASCTPAPASWQYNEFDTNGLSTNDLAGVFYSIDAALPKTAPQYPDTILCGFLKNKTGKVRNWPFYLYQFTRTPPASSLYLYRYIECESKFVPHQRR